jgi:plastocyanin
MQRVLSIVVWGAALTLTACGGGGGSSNPVSPTPGGGTSTPNTITIRGVNGKLSFNPNPASVPVGTTVVFKNADTVTHRIVLDDASIDTGDIAPGQTSRELQLGGVNKSYHCTIHPSMVGSLNSADTPEPPPCTGYCG